MAAPVAPRASDDSLHARVVLTLLFTDIEGSTRQWESDPEHMEEAVHEHNRVIAAIVGGAGGTIVRFMGDGVFAHFGDAAAAVEAAIAIQHHVRDQSWPGLGPLRLRAGLHTGPCRIRDGEVFGRAPNLASRLESAAHGGQILVSNVTARACAGRLPPGHQLFDLGRYHIRGFDDPVVVHSVVADGLPSVFPPLRTPYRGFDELPSEDSTLYGREAAVDEIGALLREHRLVTLWGPGGVGKTRIALRVALLARRPYEDGVRFVDLSTADDQSEVAATVASALRAQPAGGESAAETALRVLRHSRVLLVLDNCEAFPGAVRELARAVITACPDVHVLVTSRETLHLRWEHAVEVRGLPVPREGDSDPERIAAADAVRLFVDRARRTSPHFSLTAANATAVAVLCRTLDGMPLAIELAAGRLDVEMLEDLADDPPALISRLDGEAARSPGGAGLLSPVRWAVARLPEADVDLFRRLATFAGSFTRHAALQLAVEPVPAGQSFDRLVRTSLVVRDTAAGDRFRLLATAREYARAVTGDAQRDTCRRAHARLMLARVEALSPRLRTRDERQCTETVRADFADYRAAVDLFLEAGDAVAAARIVVALFQFAIVEPRPEVYVWALAVAARIDDTAPTSTEVVGAAALGAWYAGNTDLAIALGERAIATAAPGDSTRLARNALVDAFAYSGRIDETTTHYLALIREERSSDDPYWQISGLVHEAISRAMMGQSEIAEQRAEQALVLARRLGCPNGMQWAMYGLGRALALRDPTSACVAFEQAMDAARQVNSRFTIGLALVEWVELRRMLGDEANAIAGTSDLLELISVSGNRSQLSQVLREAGMLLARAGRHEVAALVLLARRGLPEMPKAPYHEPADQSCLEGLRGVLGDAWTPVAIRAKALDEHELISLCRRELADVGTS